MPPTLTAAGLLGCAETPDMAITTLSPGETAPIMARRVPRPPAVVARTFGGD